jgi:hypothetical protein
MGTQLWCILHPERKASECPALPFGAVESHCRSPLNVVWDP